MADETAHRPIEAEPPEPRRIGRFRISHTLLRGHQRDVLAALQRVLIVRAESRWDLDCIEYSGVSDDFEPVPNGIQAPYYTVTIDRKEDGSLTFKWTKSDEQ